ncbi:MAG: GMP synthase-like glutamine amidotransferase [Limisphaerales bacterium]|jgi:GMP synthase-like glutamine amidotransferase
MKIAILQTDHVLDQFQKDFGDYPEMFRQIIDDSQSAVSPVIECVDATVAPPLTIDCDAYLITGSRHSVYDDLPWMPPLVDFLRSVLAADKKIIGICFGHQLIAHFFGGHVEAADAGWAVGVHQSNVNKQYSWMKPQVANFNIISSHKDQVSRLPEGAEVYAGNAFCPIGGFVWRDQVITIQGHPEFSKGYSQALMSYRREIIGEPIYAQGVASLEQATDAPLVMGWLLDFLSSEKDLPKRIYVDQS